MSHRPFPSLARARHQLDRHDDETPPLSGPQSGTPVQEHLAVTAQEILRATQPTIALAAARLRAAFQPRPAGSEEKIG